MLTRRGALSGALKGAGLATAALAVPASAAEKRDGLHLRGLKANLCDNPLGVENQDVRLSWQCVSSRPGTLQTAWRVEVASSDANLRAGLADLWDSGRVESDQTFDVIYAGKPLGSRERAVWRVTAWDCHGRVTTSKPGFWEMALLSPEDWHAEWLAAEDADMRADREAGLFWVTADAPAKDQSCQVRLVFDLEADAETTLLTISSTSYEARIDGSLIDLPPRPANAWGPRGVVETVRTLKAGTHVLTLSLKGEKPQCAMLVRARLRDGQVVRFDTLTARASSEKPEGWTRPEFDASAWPTVKRSEREDQPLPGKGAFMMRRDFTATDAVVKARLYVTALGAYEAYINGKRVGDALLAPESMDFSKRILYRVFDVTKMVGHGENVIGAMVADGWYGSYTSPQGRFAFGNPPLRFMAQLELTYTGGRVERVVTDQSWMISASPVLKSDIYDGEDYDARREQPGWAAPGFQADARWSRVAIAPSVTGKLQPTLSPPIRRMGLLKPKSLKAVNGSWVVDFGQNFAGFAKIRVKGIAGQKVTLKFAEIIKSDGSVDQANLRAALATDTYVLKGDPAGEVWEPRFTYHGFRYVEISGLSNAPAPNDVVGVVIHSDTSRTGHLRIGHPIIQTLWQNSFWSQKSNFMGIPTDCPQRDERLGWMGDAHVFWDAAAFNMDVSTFTKRWMADVRDAQWPNGAFAFIAPNSMRDTAPNEASPGWADAGVILPWTTWQRFGDTEVINQNWEAMSAYIGYIAARSDDGIWSKGHGWDFGDWLALDSRWPGDHTTPPDLIGTAMWKHSTLAMLDMAKATNRQKAVEDYTRLAEKIDTAFAKTFIHSDASVGNGSQTGYILALRYNLVPAQLRAAVARKLHDSIVSRGRLLTTGFLGTPHSLDVLADNGYAALVYDLLLRTEYPSWGYMVMKGATTTWERWNGDAGDISMNSFNHYALGAVIGFVYRRIAGIDPIEPGFRRFRFNPVLDRRVGSGGAQYDAVSGRISTDWTLNADGHFRLKLSVPSNTRAEVHLPAMNRTDIRENGKPLASQPLGTVNDRVVIEAGPGDYDFAVMT